IRAAHDRLLARGLPRRSLDAVVERELPALETDDAAGRRRELPAPVARLPVAATERDAQRDPRGLARGRSSGWVLPADRSCVGSEEDQTDGDDARNGESTAHSGDLQERADRLLESPRACP